MTVTRDDEFRTRAWTLLTVATGDLAACLNQLQSLKNEYPDRSPSATEALADIESKIKSYIREVGAAGGALIEPAVTRR